MRRWIWPNKINFLVFRHFFLFKLGRAAEFFFTFHSFQKLRRTADFILLSLFFLFDVNTHVRRWDIYTPSFQENDSIGTDIAVCVYSLYDNQ